MTPVADHIAELRRQGVALAEAAARAGLDAPVPSCPGWTVRDLLAHTGVVHDWAAGFVRREPGADPDACLDPVPIGGDPVTWYRERHAALVDVLQRAPADLDCWAFLPAPGPLAFWARRQAHETAVHRADAALATGAPDPADGLAAEFALDGIDELLCGFMARRGRLRSVDPYRLLVAPDDGAQRWSVEVGPDGAVTRREDGAADAVLRGPAARLYLFLWNRLPDVPTDGDPSVVARWRNQARVI